MKQKLMLMIAVAMLVPLAGCWSFEGPGGGGDRLPPDDGYEIEIEGEVGVSNASLRGDIGAVRSFDLGRTQATGYRDGYGYTNLSIEATTDRGELVMGIIYMDPRVLDQEPGTVRTYSLQGGDEPFMDVTGCSGDNGTIDFDVPAQEVEVVVEPSSTNPQMRTVTFVATFESEFGAQQSSGSFDIEIPADGATRPDSTRF